MSTFSEFQRQAEMRINNKKRMLTPDKENTPKRTRRISVVESILSSVEKLKLSETTGAITKTACSSVGLEGSVMPKSQQEHSYAVNVPKKIVSWSVQTCIQVLLVSWR